MSKISGRVGAISFLVFAACLTLPAQAVLLDPAEIDAARLLPPPPMAGSATAKAEVAELHAIAASRQRRFAGCRPVAMTPTKKPIFSTRR